MKKTIVLFVATFISLSLFPILVIGINPSKNGMSISEENKPRPVKKPIVLNSLASKVSTIDNSDTVVYDLFNSNLVGNKVTFPVKFFSDDTVIFALDFSFKYNQVKLKFDTVINLKPGIFSSLSFYNTSDSTVRFTSSGLSLASFPDSIEIAAIRFTVLSGTLSASDLNTVKSFLNGDLCSSKVRTYSTVGLQDVNKDAAQLSVFPNPTNNEFNIVNKSDATAQLLDLNGKQIVSPLKVFANQTTSMDVSQLAKGIYMLKVFNNNSITTTKVVIK
jgi:Secretion system C-terminal sorting domain/Cohesin domain